MIMKKKGWRDFFNPDLKETQEDREYSKNKYKEKPKEKQSIKAVKE